MPSLPDYEHLDIDDMDIDAATALISDSQASVSQIRRARRRIPMLLRAGATVLCGNQPESPVLWRSPRRWRRETFDFYAGPDTADVRIAAAEELSTYFLHVVAAGSFAKYDASRRAPFVAMLERVGAFPIPNEMIAIVCAFWLRAGEYYGGSDADARGENLENLRAMLAESDDEEELPS